MTSRERLRLGFRHGIPDRLPMMDSYWNETLDRWKTEGIPADFTMSSLRQFFGLERTHVVGCDHTYRLPHKVLEENDTFVITHNSMGMVQKAFKNHAGAPAYLDHLIKSKADWEKHRPLISPKTAPDRVPEGELQTNLEEAKAGAFSGLYFADPIWTLFHSCGFENGLIMMIEDPEWAAEVVMAFTELEVAWCEELIRCGFVVDGILVYGDIAGNNGPFFSPDAFDQVLAPAYRLLFGFARSHDWTGMLHSDGDVRPFMSRIADCGIDALHPFDSRAGMDVRELKPIHGDRLTFVGNISKDAMAGSKDQIEEEVKTKLEVAMVGGGYVYHSDHSVPPSVSLENYVFTLECVRRYGVYRS